MGNTLDELRGKLISFNDAYEQSTGRLLGQGGVFDILYNKTSKPIVTNELLGDFEAFKDLFNQSSLSAEALAEEIGGVDDRIISYAKTCKNGEMTTKGFSTSLEGMTLKAKAGQVALKGLSLVGNALAGIAVSFVVTGLIKGIDYLINREEKLKESLSDSIEAFESTTSEIKSLDEQVKTLGENIAELQKLKDAGTISIADDEELQKLKEENDELERQIALLQDKQIREAKQVLKDAKKQEDDYVQSRYSLGNNVTPAEELWMGTQAYIDAINSDNDALAKEHGERVADMYEKIQPTLEAYRSLEEAGYTLSESEQKHFDELKKGEDAYLMYTYLTNNTKEAFVALNQEMQKSVMLRHLVMEKGMTEEQAGFVLNNIDPEDYEALYDTEFTPPALTDYATAEEYGKAYAEAWLSGIEENVQSSTSDNKIDVSTITDSVKTIADQLEPQFQKLGEAYQNIFTEDGFTKENIDNSMLEDLRQSFAEIEEDLGVVFDATELESFFNILTNGASTAEDIQNAFNGLATSYLNSTDVLEQLNDETADSIIKQLKQLGVTNAEEIVTLRLAAQQAFLAEKKRNSAIESENLANATYEEITAVYNAGNASAETSQYLAQLALSKLNVNKIKLNTNDDVNNIIAIANAAGASGAYVDALRTALINLQNASAKGGISGLIQQQIAKVKLATTLASLRKNQLNASDFYANVNFDGNSGTLKNSSSSSQREAEETVEDFNWIERAAKKVQRTITNLGKTVSATYKTWSTRNNALKQQISAVNEEISTQQKAYDYYMRKANSLGLSSSYVSKIQNGTISVETITDENLIEKIKSYQEFYDQALEAQDAIVDLRDELANLARQKFDNVASEYENQISVIEHEINMLESYIDQTETRGYLVSTKYYSSLAQTEKENIALLEAEYSSLNTALTEAMDVGRIEKFSEEWYDMVGSINDVEEALVDANSALIEYQNSLRELEWEYFDKQQEMISELTAESEFLRELMSDENMFDEKGNATEFGNATLGLHAVDYNTYMSQADDYARELLELNKELAEDPNNQLLLERRQELLEAQRDMILAAEDEKQAMKDLMSEGYDALLSYMDNLINKRKDMLQQIKDLYDFEKTVSEQAQTVTELRKIQASLVGDTSEEGRLKQQQNIVELKEAENALQETMYEKYISDQEQMLDTLYSETEEWINQRLDDLNQLVQDVIDSTNTNSESIKETLETETDKVGITLSDEMQAIWSGTDGIKNVVSMYGDNFNTNVTTVNNTLLGIKSLLESMIKESDKTATENTTPVKNPTTTTPATKPSTSTPTTTTKPSTTNTASTGTIKVGGKINAGSAKIYDYAGDKSGERQLFRNDPIYTVLAEKNGYLKVRHHKLSSGVTGWFKKSDVKAYKTGGLVDYTGLAWVDGTKRKPEAFLNSEDRENISDLTSTLREMSSTSSGNVLSLDQIRNLDFSGNMKQLYDVLAYKRPEITSRNMEQSIENHYNIELPNVHNPREFAQQFKEVYSNDICNTRKMLQTDMFSKNALEHRKYM